LNAAINVNGEIEDGHIGTGCVIPGIPCSA
jgi:hypothetical protein